MKNLFSQVETFATQQKPRNDSPMCAAFNINWCFGGAETHSHKSEKVDDIISEQNRKIEKMILILTLYQLGYVLAGK